MGVSQKRKRWGSQHQHLIQLLVFALVGMMLIVVFTYYGLMDTSKSYQIHEITDTIHILKSEIEKQYFTGVRDATISFSTNDQIIDILDDPLMGNDTNVLIILETMKDLLDASLVYVMNTDGTVVASTIYNGNKSLTGNNYAFRPYFQEAIKGNAFVYGAVGVTTLERGIYFSAPIIGEEIQGVIVIKKGLDALDEILESSSTSISVVSPEGIIFASNQEHLYHSFTQLPEDVIQTINQSKQFAEIPIISLNATFQQDILIMNDQSYYYSQEPFNLKGWSIISFDEVSNDLMITSSANQFYFVFSSFLTVLLFISLILYSNVLKRKKAECSMNTLNQQLEEQSKTLEDKVNERTRDLQQKIQELEQWKKVTIGRELRMAEMKKEMKLMKDQCSRLPQNNQTEEIFQP